MSDQNTTPDMHASPDRRHTRNRTQLIGGSSTNIMSRIAQPTEQGTAFESHPSGSSVEHVDTADPQTPSPRKTSPGPPGAPETPVDSKGRSDISTPEAEAKSWDPHDAETLPPLPKTADNSPGSSLHLRSEHEEEENFQFSEEEFDNDWGDWIPEEWQQYIDMHIQAGLEHGTRVVDFASSEHMPVDCHPAVGNKTDSATTAQPVYPDHDSGVGAGDHSSRVASTSPQDLDRDRMTDEGRIGHPIDSDTIEDFATTLDASHITEPLTESSAGALNQTFVFPWQPAPSNAQQNRTGQDDIQPDIPATSYTTADVGVQVDLTPEK